MAQQLLQDPAVKREKEGDPDSPQVVELTEPPRMSPITVQLRQVNTAVVTPYYKLAQHNRLK